MELNRRQGPSEALHWSVVAGSLLQTGALRPGPGHKVRKRRGLQPQLSLTAARILRAASGPSTAAVLPSDAPRQTCEGRSELAQPGKSCHCRSCVS